MGIEFAERSLEPSSGQSRKPAIAGSQPSTWSEAKRHWHAQGHTRGYGQEHVRGHAQARAVVPARRRHLEWVQPFLERHLGRNPWIALGGAFLAWSGTVLLVLSLLEVIRL